MLYVATNLTKVYGDRTVLEISKLEIESGLIHVLLGPNGSGKTTLLNILGFLDTPSSGQIHYRSQSVRFAEADLHRLRREVIMVDQHPILFTTTVFKNLEFGLKIRGVGKIERERIIDETLELVGMRHFVKAQAQHLSGGETQRVAIARALALTPKVFLCDEPTASVDIENQNIIIEILQQINETKNITVLFTTHDRAQAVGLAHRTLVLDHGRLVSAVYENVFSGQVESDVSGKLNCTIQNKISLKISQEYSNIPKGKARVIIDPEKIDVGNVGDKGPQSKSIRGRVVQVMAENSKVRVVVDAGIPLSMSISKNKYRQIHPLVGDFVSIHIPPEAVQVFHQK